LDEEASLAGAESIERLVRELYGLAAIRRDAARRAFSAQAIQGLSALWAVEQLGPCRVGAVAEALHIDLSGASRQLAALADAGHVRRERDPEDGRSQRIAITASGQAALAAAHARMTEAFSDAVETWSDDDVDGLAETLARLTEDYASAVTGEIEVAR
jgi:DNA-binding MarR family transcriptional regulator